MKRIDLTGKRFGRLVVQSFSHREMPRWRNFWLCRCDCGSSHVVDGESLRSGASKSCGCYRRERAKEAHSTHGHARVGGETDTYHIWQGIRKRCYNRASKVFSRYGARGISMCDRWKGSFEAFLADMGERPGPQYSIDRIDNDGNYCPENCRWATRSEQARNTRRNHMIEYRGQLRSAAEWAEVLHINYQALISRLHRGWTVERAFSQPVRHVDVS